MSNSSSVKSITSWFVSDTRSSGEPFFKLGEDAPEWFSDAVLGAHEDESPNDWRYETCREIVFCIADECMEPGEIADRLADVYNGSLSAWLAGDLGRAADVDEFVDNYGWSSDGGIWSAIRGGQYLCIDRMACVILQAFEDAYQSDDASTDGLELDEWIAAGCPMVLDAYHDQLAEVAAEVDADA